jgi:hypothetical protein
VIPPSRPAAIDTSDRSTYGLPCVMPLCGLNEIDDVPVRILEGCDQLAPANGIVREAPVQPYIDSAARR